MESSRDEYFEDHFLRSIDREFGKRRKALSTRGKFEVDRSTFAQDGEWVRFIHRGASRPFLVVEFLEGGTANIYVRSPSKPNKGKVLFRLEGLRLWENAKAILDAFEATLNCLQGASSIQLERESAAIRELWQGLSPRSL